MKNTLIVVGCTAALTHIALTNPPIALVSFLGMLFYRKILLF
ncbi:hypothetical protein GR7B_00235 [Vibrio phage vB_VcorM_GR7B]|nr:hypothetical protein GR7B_00235 [Vibrio phage vB_VcorM_GR7B]